MSVRKENDVVSFPLLEFEDGMPSLILAGGRKGPTSDTLLQGQATQLLIFKVRRNHEKNIDALRQQAKELRANGEQKVDMLTTETEEMVNAAIKKLESEQVCGDASPNVKEKRKRA